MGGSGIVVAIVILVVFLGGGIIGLIAMVAVAVRREERLFSLSGDAPDAVTKGARRLTAAGCRGVSLADLKKQRSGRAAGG